jgi:hypothetical protein
MSKYCPKFLILICLFFISIGATGQYKKNNQNFKRFFFGGDFWLSFGTRTYIDVSPLAGYRISNRLSAGAGLTYIYEMNKLSYLDTTINGVYYYRTYKIKTSTYGGRVFMSYDLITKLHEYIPLDIGTILVHCENEVLNLETFLLDTYSLRLYPSGNRIWIDNFLIGGGIRQPIGEKASIFLLVLWDVTQNEYSPHTNPFIRVGFTF